MKHSLTLLLAMAVLLAWFTPAARGATDAEIDQAIQDGLAWLATQQHADGSFGSGYYLANTATAVLAFENEGHFPGGATAYSTNVEEGLDYIFTRAYKIGINPQTYGYAGRNDDPDTNGNGQGVYFSQSSYMYETGLVMQALAASNTPGRVASGDTYVAIAAGPDHSLALKADGSIFGWGYNYYGQASPPAGSDYVAIAGGYYHGLALKADGSIVGWGYNRYGQVSPPAGNDYVAIAAGRLHSLALKADGSIVAWGWNNYGQINVPAGNDFVAIATGFDTSLALKTDGSIVGWGGTNNHGQATPPPGNNYVAIAAGINHSVALKADGSIVGWGANQYAQPTPAGTNYVAIAAGGYHSLALKADGSIVGWGGYNRYGQVSNTPAGTDFVAIAAGRHHSLALKAGGSIVAWGRNDYGQANSPGGACEGMTYEEVMTDLVDFLAWAQTDGGPGRGGWRYGIYNNAAGYGDNSVAQWPVLGLVAAEQWGIYAPQFVKDEMEYWVDFIQQDSSGGSGYHVPDHIVNISKTGGLLVEFYYLGDDMNTLRAQAARGYIDSRWNVSPYGTYYGNKGHPYAMFSVFKGLELMQVLTVPSAPANPDTPAGDWWGDYCEYLVNTQAHPGPGLGYWGGYYYWGRYLATPWYIIILQASVFPISVDIVVPEVACDITGHQVDVHYSVARFTASGTLSVYRDDVLYDTVTLTDFKGEATVTYSVASEEIGSHTWKAVLDVTGGGISTQVEDTDGTEVYATPQVTDIPDQFAPFETFDLDDYQTCECADVDWAALGVPEGWTVTIDADNVVTVIAPEGATDPADITFQATFHWPGIDCIDSDTATFSLNRPPVADPGKDYGEGEKYYVDEGGSVELDGTQSYDPDGDAITHAWDLDADGTFETPGATVNFSAENLDGPSEVYVYLQVCDEYGACNIGMAEVEIENVAPTIEAITAPLDPVNINDQPVSVEVTFSDPGIPDTHEVTWDWGDETSDIQPGATSPASQEHTYAEPGVYTVTVTVTDDDGGTVSQTYDFIVVYDPSAGFVTGGGWIDSPEGAYKPEPSLTGKANFGFVSKYKKGANVPTGQTEFQFKTAGLNFHSSSYEWLVVTGSDFARYKGAGTINGEGDYNFMLWAGDSKPDTFRIKIWEENEEGVETVIYDNGFNQPIGNGSIVVRSK